MDPEKRYWQARYDEAAKRFDEDYRTGRWVSRYYYDTVQEALLRLLATFPHDGQSALDVCCGSGALLDSIQVRFTIWRKSRFFPAVSIGVSGPDSS